MKINWKQKLSSRKLWALAAALVVSVMVAWGAPSSTVERVTAIVTAVGACIAYILGEATEDAGRNGSR